MTDNSSNMEDRALALRIQLAEALLDAGNHAEALEHFGSALGQDPTNVAALSGAARAAEAVGDARRAEGYRRLLAGLSNGADTEEHASGVTEGAETDLPSNRDPGTSPAGDRSQRERLRVLRAGEDADLDWMAERSE